MSTGESNFELFVPESVYQSLVDTHGAFVESISGIDRHRIADDALSQAKAVQQADVLERHVRLAGRRVLEIGAGQGTNLIVWSRQFGADMVGIEPASTGFDESFQLARELAAANGLDPDRIINAVGENLPFADDSFDVVFSANVLEHTNDPAMVLSEAVRVLRPGGVLQFVFPNYHSYFDGHYGVVHPPLFTRKFFPWYVKAIYGRDPSFARTLRTELNVGWVKKQLSELRKQRNIEVVDMGETLFLQRITTLDFAAWASLVRIKRLLDMIGNRHVRTFLGRFIIALRGWTPIVLTLHKR